MSSQEVFSAVSGAIAHRRSIRRFQQKPVSREILTKLVDLGRLYASGANKQPIRYGILTGKENTDLVFSQVKWAMFLPDFKIAPTQQPPAYILLMRDTETCSACGFDVGAAATTIMIAAEGCGLSTCCLGAFSREELAESLHLPQRYAPELLIAVGYADQQSDAVAYTDTNKYSENPDGSLSVPKYSLEQVLVLE